MDGDICRQIRDNIQWIGHVHVGGFQAGTNQRRSGAKITDSSQETIADLGFSDYVAHEWTPSAGRDPIESLARAIEILSA